MPAATTPVQSNNPFIKQLASSDRKVRDRALSSLRIYLSRSQPFTDLDLLRLWKGLFFCMWMSDKPLTQQRLAHDLANLVTVLKGNDNFLGFINAFWKTMAREWSGIDALRMDKYLYLVRCYVGKGFEVMSARQWADEELLEKYLAVLEETPLNARDVRILNGMRFHVVDLYVDELDKVDGERSAPLEKILGPVRKLGRDSVTKPVGKRVKEALDDERLQDWQGLRSEEGSDSESVEGNEIMADADDDDDEFGGFDD